MGNPIRTARTQQSPSCSPGPRGYHLSGHGLAGVPKGSRASFRTGQHSGKKQTRINLDGPGSKARGCCWKGDGLGSICPTTAADLRGTRAGTRRLWVQGDDWARRRRLGVCSLQHLARRSGEGASPDSTHQLLRARRGRAAAARAPGEHGAQLSPNGEVYKQKRAPHGSPAGPSAAQRLRNHRTRQRVRRGLDRARGPNTQAPWDPTP